jgi:steroid delta-isomerase-like uncharacterized protein
MVPAPAKERPEELEAEMVEANEASLSKAVEAWNSGNLERYLDLYAEDIKLHAGSLELPNKHSVRQMYSGMFDAVSDIRLEIHEVFGVEDKLSARYTVTAKHTGDLMGMPPSGKEFAINGITIMHFERGQVTERWDVDDSFEVLSGLRGA